MYKDLLRSEQMYMDYEKKKLLAESSLATLHPGPSWCAAVSANSTFIRV